MDLLLHGQESSRLSFRNLSQSDWNQWLPFFEDPQTTKYWNAEKLDPGVACSKWYDNQYDRYKNNMGGMNALHEKKSGLLIGHCGLLLQTVDGISELEIAYSLLPAFWNQGFATEAALKCKAFAFRKKLAPSLISIISLQNIPSQRVALKVGMAVEKRTTYKDNEVDIYRWRLPTEAAD